MRSPTRRGVGAGVLVVVVCLAPLALGAQRRAEGAIPESGRVFTPRLPGMVQTQFGRQLDLGAPGLVAGGLRSPGTLIAEPDSARKSNRGRHAAIGAIAGGVVGGVAGLILGSVVDVFGEAAGEPEKNAALKGALAGAAIFGLIGAGIGALFP